MAKDYEQVVVKGELNWVCFNTPNKLSSKYQAEVCNLSDSDIAKLKKAGLGERVRAKDDKPEYGSYITVKSNVKKEEYRNNEEDLRWFGVTDPQRLPVDLNTIGNGTEALVKIEAVDYDNDFGKGIKADIKQVVITKLVEYTGGANNDDMYEAAGNLPELAKVDAEVSGDGWGDDEEAV